MKNLLAKKRLRPLEFLSAVKKSKNCLYPLGKNKFKKHQHQLWSTRPIQLWNQPLSPTTLMIISIVPRRAIPILPPKSS